MCYTACFMRKYGGGKKRKNGGTFCMQIELNPTMIYLFQFFDINRTGST